MHANLLLTVKSEGLSRHTITETLHAKPTSTRHKVKKLLKSHGRAAQGISANEMSEWQLEASTSSGDVSGAIRRIISKLPKDFSTRMQKIPKSHVCLSIAIIAPKDFQFIQVQKKNLDWLNAIGASLEVLIFSQKDFSFWNDSTSKNL
jgi:hypothetical protein